MSHIIDSHCHLDLFHEQGILDAVLKRAYEANVKQFIAIGTNKEDWKLYKMLSQKYSEIIYYTVGVHPCEVGDDWHEQVKNIPAFFDDKCLPIGIGEIGLDYHHLPENPKDWAQALSLQKEAFEYQLSLVKQFNCPVVIHSRNAFQDCLEMIDNSGIHWNKVVFHCFTESTNEIQILNKKGARASFTGIVTYKNAPDVRQALLKQALDLLMIETDAPYLAPVPQRGKTNEPAYLAHTATFCAALFNMEEKEFVEKIYTNTRAFFGC